MQKQKMKHNKKRNTAFLYEVLVKELTKCVIEKDVHKKNQIVSILKEFFSKGTLLHAELSLYRTLNETKNLERKIAEKILLECRFEYEKLPQKEIFNQQTRLINSVNKAIGQTVFSNFVSNYKNLATVSQVFSSSSIKERVLLEEAVLERMSIKEEIKKEKMVPVDNLVYKTFIKKFNQKYVNELLEEQKDLLTNYIVSFSDNGLNLKIFLNEELERIKDSLSSCMKLEEIRNDSSMKAKTQKIIEKLELFREKEFDQKMLMDLLKIQSFIHEASING
jgi:hypothetical protein